MKTLPVNQKEKLSTGGCVKLNVADLVVPKGYTCLIDINIRNSEIKVLHQSIIEHGQLNPITVFAKKGKYVILDGVIRFKILKMLGTEFIEAVIIDKPEKSKWRHVPDTYVQQEALPDGSILYQGDSITALKGIQANSVDSLVCDPPYHLDSITKRFGKKDSAQNKFGSDGAFQRFSNGFIGRQWDGGDVAFRPEIWKECYRVLKPGGYILAFASTKNYHRMASAIEEAGFEIRDIIQWNYGTGMPKSHNVIIPIKEGSQTRANTENSGYEHSKSGEKWGTALKPAHEPICLARKPLKEKNIRQNLKKWGTGLLNIDGSRIGVDGRWPANAIFDDYAGEILDNQRTNKQTTAPSLFFYCPKASQHDRNEGLDGKIGHNIHPTVKPTPLMEYLIRLITPAGGTTMDCFMGSGSTGKAAIRNGFKFIGIEKEPEYFEIAKNRCQHEIKCSKQSQMTA